MSRIYHVRINLDAVSADLNTLVDDAERGAWLRGFMSGASGGANRFVDASPSYLGWHHGADARGHAEQFHEKQSAKGKLSAKARKSNRGSTVDEPWFNHRSTTDEPNLNLSNNPIIQESNNPKNEESINQSLPQMAEVKTSKPRNYFGPEIQTNTGKPWQLPLTTAKRHMTAYGYTEEALEYQLKRFANHKAELPQDKRPGFGGMHGILESWLAKHAPDCAATELPIRAPRLSPDALAACIEAQAKLDEQRRAEREIA
jgi:hypothetical protein